MSGLANVWQDDDHPDARSVQVHALLPGHRGTYSVLTFKKKPGSKVNSQGPWAMIACDIIMCIICIWFSKIYILNLTSVYIFKIDKCMEKKLSYTFLTQGPEE